MKCYTGIQSRFDFLRGFWNYPFSWLISMIYCHAQRQIIERKNNQVVGKQVTVKMIFVYSLGIYFLSGLVFASAFFFVGYKLILADAAGSKLSVRLLWLPGAVAIWPLLAFKWLIKRLNRAPKGTDK